MEPGIASELHALALGAACGVMEIPGDPGGVIHMEAGAISFAESTGAPGLAARLIGSRRLTPGEWDAFLEQGRSAAEVGPLLVAGGRLGADELAALLRSVILDALIALAAPTTHDAPGGRARPFHPAQPRSAEPPVLLDAESTWEQATRAAARLRGLDIALSVRPQLCDLGSPWASIRPGPWALACRIDGVTSVRELAWGNGLAVHDTIEWLGELSGAGLCLLPGPARVPADDTGPPRTRAGRSRSLPRRRPGAARWALLADEADTTPATLWQTRQAGTGTPAAPPDMDLLRRVLQGLKRMQLAAAR